MLLSLESIVLESWFIGYELVDAMKRKSARRSRLMQLPELGTPIAASEEVAIQWALGTYLQLHGDFECHS